MMSARIIPSNIESYTAESSFLYFFKSCHGEALLDGRGVYSPTVEIYPMIKSFLVRLETIESDSIPSSSDARETSTGQ